MEKILLRNDFAEYVQTIETFLHVVEAYLPYTAVFASLMAFACVTPSSLSFIKRLRMIVGMI